MKDPIVIQSLQKRNFTFENMDEYLVYAAVEGKPRVLDKPPKRLSMQRMEDVQVFGACNEFVIVFNDLASSMSPEQGRIVLGNTTKYCDPKVFIVLQTLIRQGFTKTQDIAVACLDLFKNIVMNIGDVLTEGKVYEFINKYQPVNYYAKEFVKAIRICLFNENTAFLYWTGLCEFNGFYLCAMELGRDVITKNCTTEKDVDNFLKPLYTEARKDAEFMKGIYKPACNKWLIAMLYYLKDSHPEALDPGNKGEFGSV